MPGVANAWTMNSAVIVENAVPISTASVTGPRAGDAQRERADARDRGRGGHEGEVARGHHRVTGAEGGDEGHGHERREHHDEGEQP